MSDVKISIAWHSIKYILTIVFCVLKICGVINWNWIWVFYPILVSIAAKLIRLIAISFLVCIVPWYLEWIERWDE